MMYEVVDVCRRRGGGWRARVKRGTDGKMAELWYAFDARAGGEVNVWRWQPDGAKLTDPQLADRLTGLMLAQERDESNKVAERRWS